MYFWFIFASMDRDYTVPYDSRMCMVLTLKLREILQDTDNHFIKPSLYKSARQVYLVVAFLFPSKIKR